MEDLVTCETLEGSLRLVPRRSLRPRRTVYGLVFDRQGRLLAIALPATGKFVLPGGGVEVGESDETALRREVAEETGVPVEPGPVVGDSEAFYWDEPSGEAWHIYVRCLLCWATDVPSVLSQSPEGNFVWLYPAELSTEYFQGPSRHFVASQVL
ncbi:MAG: NUDIX hydrolase [Actinomycetota bacterium]|nr:NUDIX hydrolase [Actinomycetota bacterium]